MFFVGFCISLLRALRVIRKIMKESDFWCTPLDLYPVDCFDPCPKNPSFDGLSVDWFGNVFCNPPYSQIDLWVDKALQQVSNADSIVMLLPNWTDRAWFQKIAHCPIQFLRGRLRFVDPKTGLPGKYNPRFGSMLVKIK